MSEGTSVCSIGPLELLTIMFIGLKLAGYIDWSWWWVLSPIWIGLVLACFAVGGESGRK